MARLPKAGIAAMGLIIILVVFLMAAATNIDPSPLGVGATADEAWTYIHTNSTTLAPAGASPFVDERSSWRADPRSIEHETRLYWRTNRLFATRKVVYTVDTNSVISSVRSRWKFTWPF